MTNIESRAGGVLAALSVPVFLAGYDAGQHARVTLHVAPRYKRRALETEAETALARIGIATRCRVRPIKYRRIGRARSVEGLLQAFAHDSVLHDPTGCVTRGGALMRCGAGLRRALGKAATGLYFEPRGRTLYVLCRVEDADRQRAIEAQAATAILAWRGSDAGAFDFAVRLCVAVPRLSLVPLDDSSPIDPRAGWRGRLHSGLAAGGVATLLGAMFPGLAQADGPAVSAVNAKVSGEGGDIGGHGGGIAEGSVAFPLGYSFGGQLDVGAGSSNGQGLWGVAGQAFWRDPGQGLIGGFAMHANHDIPTTRGVSAKGASANRFGAEGEYYYGQFTPSVAAGYQNGTIKKPGGFVVLDLAWYPIDNLQLSGGADLNSAHSRALFGAEYQLGVAALPGLTTFMEAGITGQRDSYALAGLRIYFGPAKTLIRRHREDDPGSPIIGGVDSSFHNTSGNY